MKKFIWLHAIVEIIAGILFYLKPDSIFIFGNIISESLPMIKMYSIAVFIFGLSSALIAQKIENQLFIDKFMMLLIGFHMMISFHCYGMFQSGFLPNMSASLLHLLLFIILTGGYLYHKKEN